MSFDEDVDDELSAANTESAIEALTLVLAEIGRQKDRRYGRGVIECPRCKGVLTFTFTRHPGRSRTLRYSAVCASKGCVRFLGH